MRFKAALALVSGLTAFAASSAHAEPLSMPEPVAPVAPALDPALFDTAAETTAQAVAVVAVAESGASSAAQATSEPGASGWQVSVTPYLWMTGLSGDIETPQGEDIDVDKSFFDILGDLKFAFMGVLDARRGGFVTLHDFLYLNVGISENANFGAIPLEANLDISQYSSAHLIGYRVVDQGPMFLDILAGARITSIGVDAELSAPNQSFERDSSKTQVGPVIASRFRAPLGERWGFAVYGDVGGLGVNSGTSFQLMANVQFDISNHWRMVGGWRHFAAKQDKGDFEVKLVMSGPIVGFTYRF